jgi:cytochrome c biogenesis protein CcmG/thiol:disulfide interchange protein DsbE
VGRQSRTKQARRDTAPPASRGPRVPVVGIVLVLVAALAVVAVLATRGGGGAGTGDEAGLAQVRPVQVTGAPLPADTDAADDPAVGMAAPALHGAGFDGSPVAVTDDGRAKLVVFVAHWCPHCQREVPVLVQWLKDGRLPASVSLYVVSTAVDRARPNWPPSTWLREAGLTAPVLADDAQGSAASAYGLSAFPFFTATDAKGKVVARDSGELTPAQLDQLAARLAAAGT